MEPQPEPRSLPEMYRAAKEKIESKPVVKSVEPRPGSNNGKLFDCLNYILEARPKNDHTNFNKLVLHLITGFREVGYNYETALTNRSIK